MSQQEIDVLNALERRIGGDAEPADSGAASRAVEYAKDHLFERKSVVPERQLLATALKHSVGQATVEQVQTSGGGQRPDYRRTQRPADGDNKEGARRRVPRDRLLPARDGAVANRMQ